jgi:hypothetical protein
VKKEEFIDALKLSTKMNAVGGSIEQFVKPSGRSPDPDLLRISKWWNGLSEHDQNMAREIMQYAADSAIFGVLTMLDEVGSIGGQIRKFRLICTDEEGTVDLAEKKGEMLHDLYNSAP